MDVFDLQASLRLNKSDYEKALKEAEKEAEKFVSALEKSIGGTFNNITKNYSKVINDNSTNIINVYKTITKEAESSATAQKKIAESTWKNISTVASTYVQNVGKTLSSLGAISKTAFNAVYDAGKFAFSGVSDLASDAFSSFHDIDTDAISGVTDLIGTATNALIEFGKQSVTVGMDFDKSMSQVAATLETTIDEINNGSVSANFSFEDFSGSLREMAIELGENTKFTASEVADAINNMALAGYKQQEIADLSEFVLNGASAWNIGVAEASTYVTKSANAMGLSPEEVRLLVDQMSVGASNSGSAGATLGQGIMKIGAQARTLAGGTTELIQILGLLSDAGENLTGSMGGTALKNIIKHLQNPRSDAAAARFEQMGIQTYDSETGDFRKIQDIVTEFRNYFLDTLGENYETKQEFSEIMNDIFTSYSITGMTALIGTDPEKFENLWNRLSDADGAAERMAAEQKNNLAGDVTIFGSALDAVKIRISDVLTPELRDFVQFSTEQMGRLSKAIKEGGIDGGFEMLTAVVGDTAGKINTMLPSIVKSATKTIKAFVSGIRNNAKTIGKGFSDVLVTLAKAPAEILPDIVDGGIQLTIAIMDGMTDAMPTIITEIPKLIRRIASAVRKNEKSLKESGKALLESVFKGIEDNKKYFDTAFRWLYDFVVVPAFDTLFIDIPDYVSEKLDGLDTSGIGSAVRKLIDKLDISGAVSSAGSLFQTIFTKAGEFLGSEDFGTAGIISSAVSLGNDIFNGAIDILFGEDGLDWEKIGEGINSVVQNIDYKEIGGNINQLANGFLDSTNTLLKTIDWKSVGSGAGTVINGIDYGGILHKVFGIITSVISNTPDLLSGVASAIDASTANQLISMANTLALGKGITTAISLWFKSEAAASMIGTAALSLGGFLKDVFTAQITIDAIAGGCSLAFGATAVVSAVGAAIAGWSIGTLLRDAIGAEKIDNVLFQVVDSFKDAGYQIKATWDWAFNNLSGLSYDQIYKNIALDATASGSGFQSDEYRQKVLDWANGDTYETFGNGNGMSFFDFEDEINSKFETVRWLLQQNSGSDEINQYGQDLANNFGSGIAYSTAIENELQTKIDKINSMLTSTAADDSFMVNSKQSGKDMMQLFADGIRENAHLPEKEIRNFADFTKKEVGFSVPEEGALSDADTWMPDMMQLFADGIKNNSGLVENSITTLTGTIKSLFLDNSEMAGSWASDMIDNFISGINQKWNDAVNTVSGFAGMIASYLHFSEPDVGALSDFHTYAPDMVQLFADGIRQNAHIAETEIARLSEDIAESFRIPVAPYSADYRTASYAESAPAGSVVVQNLTITFPEFNINSPEDIDRLSSALVSSLAEKMTVKNIHDSRLGGAGW